MPGGETTPKQKTVIVQGKPGEPTPAQKTQVNPGKKAVPAKSGEKTRLLNTKSSVPEVRLALRPCLKAKVPAKSGEKTTPTLGRGLRHHDKNRLGVVPPAFTEPETTPKIGRRSGQAKHVSFSLIPTVIPDGENKSFFRASPDSNVPQNRTPSVLGRPVRSRRQPDRLGVGVEEQQSLYAYNIQLRSPRLAAWGGAVG
jgi:hypothetical protein